LDATANEKESSLPVESSTRVCGAKVRHGKTSPYVAIGFVVSSDGTRSCAQAVMSGGISIRFVDFAALSFDFDVVRFILVRAFLVRDWCGW
jgi:hypothetical protein